MEKIELSVCPKYYGTCIRDVNVGACSIFVGGLMGLEAPKGFWCRMPEEALETVTSQQRKADSWRVPTFGEKPMSLIMRFLLHLSS